MGILTPSTRSLRAGLVVAAMTSGLLLVPAGPARADLCIPLPGVPCIPELPALLPPTATTPTAITGTAQVGQTVTATAPVWDQEGVTTTYQWLRDGDAITGATTQTYALTGDDFGTMVSVRAIGANGSLLGSGSSVSDPVEPAKGERITATTAPVVSGTGAVGQPLTTTNGVWGEPEPTYAYQWYRSRADASGFVPIEGASTPTYTPTTDDAGRAVVVLVVADRFGYEKGGAVSNLVRVPAAARAASTTSLTLLQRTVKRTQAPTLRVVLGSRTGVKPTGRITVFDGTRRVRSITISAAAGGVVTFTIPRQTVGRHRLTARYAGDARHAPSTSGQKVLTVTR